MANEKKELEFVGRHRYMDTSYDVMDGSTRLGWCRTWDEESAWWGFHSDRVSFITSSQLKEISAKLDELNTKENHNG